MKGLLLKDFYAIKSYCRAFLFLIVIFALSSVAMEDNVFFTYYPCVLSGLIALTLIAYEEREKWHIYARTLPYSKAQLVSSKYIISFSLGIFTILIISLSQIVAMLARQTFEITVITNLFTTLMPFSLLPTAVLLPFIFKYGAEKGRIMYYIVLGAFCALVGVLPLENLSGISEGINKFAKLITFVVSFIAFGLSWILSIKLYEKREIK